MGEFASKAALEQAKVAAKDIDHVIFGIACFSSKTVGLGNVIQSSKGAIYLTRHIGLRLGVPVEVGALTVNRLCGSGFQAVVNGAQVSMISLFLKVNVYSKSSLASPLSS